MLLIKDIVREDPGISLVMVHSSFRDHARFCGSISKRVEFDSEEAVLDAITIVAQEVKIRERDSGRWGEDGPLLKSGITRYRPHQMRLIYHNLGKGIEVSDEVGVALTEWGVTEEVFTASGREFFGHDFPRDQLALEMDL